MRADSTSLHQVYIISHFQNVFQSRFTPRRGFRPYSCYICRLIGLSLETDTLAVFLVQALNKLRINLPRVHNQHCTELKQINVSLFLIVYT